MCLALLALALAAVPAAAPGIAGVAEAIAAQVGSPSEGHRGVALAIETDTAALAAPMEAALSAALMRRGWAVIPLRSDGDPEGRARGAGADWLVRVRGGLAPGRVDVTLVGAVVPTWASFFLQRRAGARPVPPRLLQARAPADPETSFLARPARPPDSSQVEIRTLARVAGRVLALAVGDPAGDGGAPAILTVTSAEAILLSARGTRLAAIPLDASARRPIRDPAAAAAIGDFGGGRIALQLAGEPQGRIISFAAGRLEPVAAIAAAPLLASEAGRLFGAFVPGKGVLTDILTPFVDPDARPRSQREWIAVAAAPRDGPIAFAALGPGGRLELFGKELSPAGAPVEGVGAGFALADLDGDGTAEVVASASVPGATERVRVIAPRAAVPVAFESSRVPGAILAGAAGDLTGDGVDDAVLGSVVAGEDGAPATDLLLVTADARKAP